MSRSSHPQNKADTFTFRIEPELKAAFVKLADQQKVSAGEILRRFIRELVESGRRKDYASEARRQSQMIAAAATQPDTDEAEVLRELDQALDQLSTRLEWQ